ncbi:hypothetical protein [Amycolatopsis sp. NPDC051061]
MFAAAIASQACARAGWPREWREVVLVLRDHPDTDVRDRASRRSLASG